VGTSSLLLWKTEMKRLFLLLTAVAAIGCAQVGNDLNEQRATEVANSIVVDEPDAKPVDDVYNINEGAEPEQPNDINDARDHPKWLEVYERCELWSTAEELEAGKCGKEADAAAMAEIGK
jgi:hypothetical protein